MSRMALEELESRCDQLQRRMSSTASDRRTSPRRSMTPGPSSGGGGSSSSSSSGAVFQSQAPVFNNNPVSNTSYSGTSSSSSSNQQQPQSLLAALPKPHELAHALQELEKKKRQLEDELTLVNTHISTYRFVMKQRENLPGSSNYNPSSNNKVQNPTFTGREGLSSAGAAAVLMSGNNTNNNSSTPSSAPSGVARPLPLSNQVSPSARSSSQGQQQQQQQQGGAVLQSPTRNPYNRNLHSPALNRSHIETSTATAAAAAAAGGGGGGGGGAQHHHAHSPGRRAAAGGDASLSSLPNDQIAEELRRIRRAREEREAQRRLSNTIAGNAAGSPTRF